MKRLALALVLFVGIAARAEAVDYTDIWYNSAQPGYGFNLVESDDGKGAPFLFATFFIYGSGGAPTWYTAQLAWNGTDAFTGNVYSTMGTFFAAPWNPTTFFAMQAGTASFKPNPNNDYQGTLTYTVTGVGSATVALVRQTLTPIATAGLYVGGQSGTYSACGMPANNGAYLDNFELQVTHNVATGDVTMQFDYPGLTCLFIGKYAQNGKSLSIPNASYTCSDGTNVTAQVTEIRRSALGIEGRFSAKGGFDNCTETAVFSGPLQ